jgi:hypothetical protein
MEGIAGGTNRTRARHGIEHAGSQIRHRPKGPVARQLAEAGGVYQYRIESEVDGHHRVAREDQLADL